MKKIVTLIILVTLTLFKPVNAKTNFSGFVSAIEDSRKLKITIDFENTAKQFGYKDFKQFFDEYKKKYDLEDLTIEEAKEYLTGADKTVEIIESEENLKILHKLILKDKFVKKYLRKKKQHAKILAIYFDYEKEMAKITKNPNLEKIGRFVSFYQWHTNKGPNTYGGQENDAMGGCERERRKRGVPDGGKCMLIEYRYGDEFKILIQPKFIKKNKIVKKNENKVSEIAKKDCHGGCKNEAKNKSIKNSKDINSNKVAASPETFLNLKEVNELSKSIVKIDYDKVDQSNGNLIQFRNELEHLFGKKKKYTDKSSTRKAQEKIADIYVTKKNSLDKYPYRTIIGMAYFEFFYAGQVDQNKKKIEKFKTKYPQIKQPQIKAIKNLYNLNEVRKKMRESIGFSLNDEPSEVIKSYIVLSKYLKNSKPKKIKLKSYEKKKIRLSQSFNKYLSIYEKNILLKKQNRITDKVFKKDLEKSFKKLLSINEKIGRLNLKDNQISFEEERFKSLYNNIVEIISTTDKRLEYKTSNYELALDSIYFVNEILKVTKTKSIKSKYDQVWEKDFNIEKVLNNEEITYLTLLGQNTKRKKFIDNNKLQSSVLNLINNNYDIVNFISKTEKQFDTKIKAIKIKYKSFEEMKNWKKSDWANSWKDSIPLDLNDNKGNLINFSDQDIEDLKAQLALNNFNNLFNNDEVNSIDIQTRDIQNSIQDIQSTNISNLLNQDFSITLDNYSRILAEDAINRFGDQFDAQTIQEIRDNANFENLTAITNMEYGTNMTSSEYKSYWENAQYMDSTSTWGDVTRGVDLISNLSSFDAAAAAKELGADLQTVADSIAQAASVGISTDLEAAAQGLGYNSFSDAVSAYNAEHGTNYTEEEAKEALGQ
ncbi:hypothetical protein OAU53_01895 [Candidatus Pelagibacter sp.]|nr:hypothetical protein [Candidatus Pelagibacter sp.]